MKSLGPFRIAHDTLVRDVGDALRDRFEVYVNKSFVTSTGSSFQPDLTLGASPDKVYLLEFKLPEGELPKMTSTVGWEPLARLADASEYIESREGKRVQPILVLVGGQFSSAAVEFAKRKNMHLIEVDDVTKVKDTLINKLHGPPYEP